MTKFARVSEIDWVLASSIGSGRIRRIRQAENFEDVMSKLVRGARVEQLRKQRACSDHSVFRLIVVFRVRPTSLDQFFNSPVGYRAQYFASCKLGERANRLTVAQLFPKVLAEAKRANRPMLEFVERSLSNPHCKVWPHQGQWLRRARIKDRVLLVPRWQAGLSSVDKKRRKLARWGSLAPSLETRLVLKGSFVWSSCRAKIGKTSTTRSRQLHQLGFT